MEENAKSADYKNRTPILVIIGGLLMLIGGVAVFLGPVEMYCFYLFSEGGRFHYEGFGFGSFMFGNIACQIMGYYLIALVLIPLGYGHLRVRRWARPLALTLLWFWLIVGVPLILVFLFMLLSAKDLSPAAALTVAVLLGLSYLAVPGLLIRFYRSRNVRLTFEHRDPQTYWIERLPIPILVLCALFSFYLVALHVLIFFNGLFPLVEVWVSELAGIFLLDISILCLACLLWGTLRLRKWAWWGALLYFGLMSISWIVTLAKSSWSDILLKMDFPPFEMEILQRLPFQGFHFAVLVGVPLLLTWGTIIRAKRYFEAEGQVLATED